MRGAVAAGVGEAVVLAAEGVAEAAAHVAAVEKGGDQTARRLPAGGAVVVDAQVERRARGELVERRAGGDAAVAEEEAGRQGRRLEALEAERLAVAVPELLRQLGGE